MDLGDKKRRRFRKGRVKIVLQGISGKEVEKDLTFLQVCGKVYKVVINRKAEYPLSPWHRSDRRFISGAKQHTEGICVLYVRIMSG